ncbi:MAG: hypothetical protein IJD68_08240 [Ruminococcus sp.]|nr:hypothetical protein [Ruminococcus sp.]
MRNRKVTTLISVLTAILMIFILSTTVFATGELGTLTPPVETMETQVVIDDEVLETEAVEEPEYDFDEEEDFDDGEGDIGYIEETLPPTEPPTYYDVYGDELPQVESQEVTEPTEIEIPDVEVTDTSLLGGVIAWLCVAVGIAVIAGVLVSQRTKRNSNSSDSRRR